jgi:hypothetical protein
MRYILTKTLAEYPTADIELAKIGDLLTSDPSASCDGTSGNDQIAGRRSVDPRGPHLAGDQWTVKFLPQVIAGIPDVLAGTLKVRVLLALGYGAGLIASKRGLPQRRRAIDPMRPHQVAP